MTNRIGPKQRPIIEALKADGQLLQEHGLWTWRDVDGQWRVVNQERCMGLYVRGFIMADGVDTVGRTRYVLTDKGRRV